MTFRMYILFMGIATVLSWVAWILVIWSIDPTQAGMASFVLFYLTLFLAFAGTLTLAGIVYRIVLRKRSAVVSRQVRIAFRHALLLSTVGILALILSAQSRFRWWIFFPLILVSSAIEYYFLLGDQSQRS